MANSSTKSETINLAIYVDCSISSIPYCAGVLNYLFDALAEWEIRRGDLATPPHRIRITAVGGTLLGILSVMAAASLAEAKLLNLDDPSVSPINEKVPEEFFSGLLNLDLLSKILDTSDLEELGRISILNSYLSNSINVSRHLLPSSTHNIGRFFSAESKFFLPVNELLDLDWLNSLLRESKGNYGIPAANNWFSGPISDGNGYYELNNWLSFFDKNPLELLTTLKTKFGIDERDITLDLLLNSNLNLFREIFSSQDILTLYYKDLFGANGKSTFNDAIFEDFFGMVNFSSSLSFTTALIVAPSSHQDRSPYSKPLLNKIIKPEFNVTNRFQMAMVLAGLEINNIFSGFGRQASRLNNMNYYAITPTSHPREPPNNQPKGALQLACNSLNGYGFFVNEKFRDHDYRLGLINCEEFLRNRFLVNDASNDSQLGLLFCEEYYDPKFDKFRRQSENGTAFQIIPIFDDRYLSDDNVGMITVDWPKISKQDIEKYKPLIEKRIHLLLLKLAPSRLQRSFLKLLSSIFFKKYIARKVVKKIALNLIENNLLDNKTKTTD